MDAERLVNAARNWTEVGPHHEDSVDGFANWPFMSLHNWGEDPDGTGTLTVNAPSVAHWAGYDRDYKLLQLSHLLHYYGVDADSLRHQRTTVVELSLSRAV